MVRRSRPEGPIEAQPSGVSPRSFKKIEPCKATYTERFVLKRRTGNRAAPSGLPGTRLSLARAYAAGLRFYQSFGPLGGVHAKRTATTTKWNEASAGAVDAQNLDHGTDLSQVAQRVLRSRDLPALEIGVEDVLPWMSFDWTRLDLAQ